MRAYGRVRPRWLRVAASHLLTTHSLGDTPLGPLNMGHWTLGVWSVRREGGCVKRLLLIVNGPAYGSDETYNAVRLAVALARRGDLEVTVS